MIKFFLTALGFLYIHFYVYHYFATNEVYPARREFRDFPLQFNDWHCPQAERMDPKSESILGVSDYLLCTYRNVPLKTEINVYLGYHHSHVREEGGGGQTNVIHTPKHCLPGSGWDIIQTSTMLLDIEGLPGRPAEINRFVIAKQNQRQVVYYWYQSQGRVTGKDWLKAVYLFRDRATRQRTDGALVRFMVPMAQNAKLEQGDFIFESLAKEILPLLSDYIPN